VPLSLARPLALSKLLLSPSVPLLYCSISFSHFLSATICHQHADDIVTLINQKITVRHNPLFIVDKNVPSVNHVPLSSKTKKKQKHVDGDRLNVVRVLSFFIC